MSATWPWLMSEVPLVNGTVNTSGSVPPANCAVKVVATQSYGCVLTVMLGFSFSKAATCWLTCWVAAAVKPVSIETVMVTFPSGDGAACGLLLEQPARTAASAAAPATGARYRVRNFIVRAFLSM